MRLLIEVDGKLLTPPADDAQANALMERATAVFIADPDDQQTVANYPSRGRWSKGGQTIAEADLPDGWDLPGGKRVQRPGGKENPHKPAENGKPEVKAKWRLQSSTNQTSHSTPKKTGK